MQQLPILHNLDLAPLRDAKNLLAFSGGVDSSALFFILKAYDIEFDLAIVDYNTREQSKEEVAYAKTLCKTYNKKVFLHECKLENSNFESKARAQRYSFFETIINENSYTNLITAHHLNDKLEWFLMQLSRGSGLVEMLGFDKIQKRDNYSIVRPLFQISKKELLNFLNINNLTYFIDKSNTSHKHTRNKIRSAYSDAFIEEFEKGVVKSFEYLQNDANLLHVVNEIRVKDLFVCKREIEDLKNIRQIDKILKKLGVLMSQAQREEVLRVKNCVISHKIAISFTDKLIYIAPFVTKEMPKEFKEAYRLSHIPAKIRPYLYLKSISLSTLESLIYKLLL